MYTRSFSVLSHTDDKSTWTPSGSSPASRLISVTRLVDADGNTWNAMLDSWFCHFIVFADSSVSNETNECIPEHEDEHGQTVPGTWSSDITPPAERVTKTTVCAAGWGLNPHALDKGVYQNGTEVNPYTGYEVWTLAEYYAEFGTRTLRDAS